MNDTPGQPTLDLFSTESPRPSQPAPSQPAPVQPQPVRPAGDPSVEVRRSRRRKRTASAYRDGERIVVLLPGRVSRAEGARLTEELVAKILAREARAADGGDLAERAARLSHRYLRPQLGHAPLPASIEWVTNQSHRWGSCTVVDRTIRLSHRLQRMPGWVVDYVIVHELAHLVYPDHSAAFWRLVEAYPRAERARGFLEGFQAGADSPR